MWYYAFLAAVFLLWLGSVESERNALRVVLVASVASFLLVTLVTSRFVGAYKLAVPATVETATIVALLRWSPPRTAFKQVACVLVAWLSHVLCFVDIQLGTDIIYDRYEEALFLVAMAQLAFFHETYTHHFRRLGSWWGAIGRPDPVRTAGHAVVVPRSPRPS